jgi:hypothetical protein
MEQTDWKQIRNNRCRNSKKEKISTTQHKQLSYDNVSTFNEHKYVNKSLTKLAKFHTTSKLPPRISLKNKFKNSSNCSYDTWEFFYFKYIVDLYEIFLNGINQLDTNININTVNTFYKFSKFIRKCSSGEISPYLETIENTNLENLYNEFTIKRNKL